MTSHQFAQQLLAGPNLEIGCPSVKEYAELDEEFSALREPAVSVMRGEVMGVEQDVLVLSYKAHSKP